ncbi:hypothetical protein KHA80_20550 [Anaerobacillus sp. HL2]|nr:hypothetical protein KHA80_20550 [Anaerobacillus sp. HL2]
MTDLLIPSFQILMMEKYLKKCSSHALSLHKPPFELFIDNCVLETHGCNNCFKEYLKNAEERKRIEQQFSDLGITLHGLLVFLLKLTEALMKKVI